mgnify:CR=1
MTFAALFVSEKREKRKEFLVFFLKRHLIRQPVADTFYPCLGDADRVCSANRSIPHWRRLAKILAFVSAQTLPTPATPIYAGRRGADPLRDKTQVQQTDKIKNMPPSWRRRPSLLRKSVNPPVSATPTEFAPQIGQSPIVAHTKNSAQFLCKITKCKFVLKKDRLFHIFIV